VKEDNRSKLILGLIPVCILVGIASTMRGTDLIRAIVIIIGLGFFSMGLMKEKQIGLVIIMFMAFFTRIGLAVMSNFFMPLPDSGADSIVFEQLGWGVANAWENGTLPPATPGAYLYSKFIGLVYIITGRSPFIIQYINVLLGLLTVYLVYKLIVVLGGSERASLAGALCAAIFPTLNMYSAIILRENVITFFSLLSVYYFVLWLKTGSISRITLSVVCLFVASSVHGAIILVGGVYLFLFCFYRPKDKTWRLLSMKAVLAIAVSVVLFGIFKDKLLSKIPSDITLLFSADYLRGRLEPLAVGRAAYLVGYYPGSLIDIFIQTPVRIIFFLFMPFPWKIVGVSDIIGSADAIMYAILIFLSFRSIAKIDKENKVLMLALGLVVILEIVTFAWGTSNFGTAIRHRQKFVCLLIAAASVGMFSKKNNGELIG